MNQWKQALKKAVGMKNQMPQSVPFAEPTWKHYGENPYRVIYLLQMKEGIEKKILYEFLTQAWIPALKGARGCRCVEMADDFAQDSGYVLLELWETKEAHDEAIPQLWYITHKPVFAKLKENASFAFLWEGIVVEREQEPSSPDISSEEGGETR